MNKDSKSDYKESIQKLRTIINQLDPEGLDPGAMGGTPEDEYDEEIVRIYNFIIHNMEKIKLDSSLLKNEINKIWNESFGDNCAFGKELTNAIIKNFF